MTAYVLAAVLGLVAGVAAGVFGVGGGILFVPVLVALHRSQLHAEATSLLAILPTVAAGAWRQNRYGNVHWKAAAVVGVVSIAGVEIGVEVAHSLSGTTLRRLFAVLIIAVAVNLVARRQFD